MGAEGDGRASAGDDPVRDPGPGRTKDPPVTLTEPTREERRPAARELLGSGSYAMVLDLGAIFTLFVQFVSWVMRPPSEIRNIVKQMEEVGSGRCPSSLVTATFTGMVLALQSLLRVQRFGATSLCRVGRRPLHHRELGPVFAGLIGLRPRRRPPWRPSWGR